MSSGRFRVTEHTLQCQHIREYPYGVRDDQADIALAVKQYQPLDNLEPRDGDVTIIGAHANGLTKELYEPLWDEVLALSRRHGFRIRAIWAADQSHQGASGVLNEHLQGDDPNWFDHSRDLLHMVNHFRSSFHRPIVGIGHSMGGVQLVQLSLLHPRLLHTLILMDPVILGDAPYGPNAAFLSTRRPDLWPSRAAAESSFRRNPFFQAWDPRVLSLYVKYGLRELPTAIYPASPKGEPEKDKQVTLTTTKHQEAWSYIRSTFEPQADEERDRLLNPDLDLEKFGDQLFQRPECIMTLKNLPAVRPSVLYIFGERSPLSPPDENEEKVKATGTGLGGSGGEKMGRVAGVVAEGVGHLVPFEDVGGSARRCAEWLETEIARWRREEEVLRGRKSGKSERDMLVLSLQWKEAVKLSRETRRPPKEKL
ncbi:MAG: hypothetical protein LQ351_005879 [Letrouitia transgressa]|nr:MAG: hypothetical protein LQ351_005879 [Letrouitia transgressa]